MFLLDSCTMCSMTGPEWKRLAQLVVSRRTHLGMKTTKALADTAGLTSRMVSDVENARRTNYSAGAKAQIENALKWAPGSITAVIDGADPVPLERLEADPDQAPPFRPDLLPGPDPNNHLDSRVVEAMRSANRGQIPAEVAEHIHEDWTIDRHNEVFAALSRNNKLRVADYASAVYIEQTHELEPGYLAEVHYSTYEPEVPKEETNDITTESTTEVSAGQADANEKTDAGGPRAGLNLILGGQVTEVDGEVDDAPPADGLIDAARIELDHLTKGKRKDLEQAISSMSAEELRAAADQDPLLNAYVRANYPKLAKGWDS